MGLLGNVVAGAVGGAAITQLDELKKKAEELRNTNLERLRSTLRREDTDYAAGKAVSYVSQDNSKAITGEEYAALPDEEKQQYRRVEAAQMQNEAEQQQWDRDMEERKFDLDKQKVGLMGRSGGGDSRGEYGKKFDDLARIYGEDKARQMLESQMNGKGSDLKISDYMDMAQQQVAAEESSKEQGVIGATGSILGLSKPPPEKLSPEAFNQRVVEVARNMAMQAQGQQLPQQEAPQQDDHVSNIISRVKDQPKQQESADKNMEDTGKTPEKQVQSKQKKGILDKSKQNPSAAQSPTITATIAGKKVEIPLLVPTLTQSEREMVMRGEKPTQNIIAKAVQYAQGKPDMGMVGNGDAIDTGKFLHTTLGDAIKNR